MTSVYEATFSFVYDQITSSSPLGDLSVFYGIHLVIHGAEILFLYWKTGHVPGVALIGTCKTWLDGKSVPSLSASYIPGSVLNAIREIILLSNFIVRVTDTDKDHNN